MLRQQAAVADLPNSAQFSPPAFPRRERLQQKQFQKKKDATDYNRETYYALDVSGHCTYKKVFFFF